MALPLHYKLMDRIGRYKIVRELGRGAMGVVYHAIDPNIGRPVAIKTIRIGEVRNPDEQKRLRERLFREARSAGMLSHPGIVTIYDVEEQEGLAYIAMEYVDGPTLDQVLSERPLEPAQMFSILGQTASALDYAHGKGIVHRDIKPANIMIAGDGTAKITDFGIAKITTSEQFTMTGSIVGTPHYMSPEQVQGQPIDGRSDQFSLAVISYEILTGEKPYTGEHLTTVVYRIVAEEPSPPHRVNPSLSGAIDAVLRKALSKKPDGRFRTCGEFAAELEKACAATKNWKAMPRGGSLNEPTALETPRPAAMLPPTRRPRSASPGTVEKLQRKSGLVPFLSAVLMAGALLALIGWQAAPFLINSRQPPPTSQTAKPEPAKSTPPTPAAATQPPPVAAPSPAPTAPPADEPDQPPAEQAAQPPVVPIPAAPADAPPGSADDTKPSPMPRTRPTAPAAAAPAKSAVAVPKLAAASPVEIFSSPAGATVIMDSRPDAVCKTPCSLDAAPGRHQLSFSYPGYGLIRREFDMGNSPLELPLVMLPAQSGTVMVSSIPPGVSVLVNGRPTGKVTPAVLQLAPGNYNIAVEKDGRQSSTPVEIRGGETKTLRFTTGQ